MKTIDIALDDLETIIRENGYNREMDLMLAVSTEQVPRVVYTSFDGDLLSHSELMKQYTLGRGCAPLNPESALGTYIVTNHFEGNKEPIIEDCMSLIDACQEFYVITKDVPAKKEDVKNLPEGVIAEVWYWTRNHRKPITFVDASDYVSATEVLYDKNMPTYLNDKQRVGIAKTTNAKKKLRPIAYLLAGEIHAKHSDWMRMDAYRGARVPLCPYTLLNRSSLQLSCGNDFLKQLLSRVALIRRADEIYIYSPYEDEKFTLSKLPEDALFELFLTLRLGPKKPVIHKYFGEVGVPKYTNRAKWAITEQERLQAE